MNPEQQRIAIAEACGWKVKSSPLYALYDPVGSQRGGFWTTEEGAWLQIVGNKMRIPDYLNDLNAMHEAEKTLDDGIDDAGSMRYKYASHLYGLTVPKNQQPIRATAPQRAEAFLRAIGKWTGGDRE